MVIFMKNKSIWSEVIKGRSYPELKEDLDVDVLIVGGGITGVNVAYHLIDSGLKVCLVEKNLIGSGVTSRTTGKLTYLQQDMCSRIKTYHGIDKAKLYVSSQKKAIALAKKIIDKEKIECNFRKVDSYIFSNIKEDKLDKEKRLLKEIGVDIKGAKSLPSDVNKEGESFYVSDTYVFHPIKYVQALADICSKKGILLFENTKIVSMDVDGDSYLCKTSNCNIRTKYVVLALHYPYFLSPFWMPFKGHLEKSYIEAFLVDRDYRFSAITISNPSISMRYYHNDDTNYQLYLSNSHNLAIKNDEESNFEDLVIQKCTKPDYLWSNKDIMTIDSLPFIGNVSDKRNLLIGTGYNTWGMTNGILAGKILSDIILGRDNPYIELFSPSRKLNPSIVNFPLILGSSAYSFLKSKISKNKRWYSSNVRFESREGKNVGIYVDEHKKEHIVYNLCPHMKCSLIFNEVEKTWDCPCHGSRFDLDGKCIEGPSNYNISYQEKE